jgi:hypothetical protein
MRVIRGRSYRAVCIGRTRVDANPRSTRPAMQPGDTHGLDRRYHRLCVSYHSCIAQHGSDTVAVRDTATMFVEEIRPAERQG